MAHRCIKPQCPRDCSECNHALPEEDEAAMLVCDLLDDFAVDGFGAPLEDGESELVDRWRAWLATRRSASLPELPTCTESQTATERYQWLRGGSDVPPHSVRWPRFEVRAWDGRHWQTLFAEQLDSAIDAAMSKDLAHNRD